jgi:nicotinate-nucleotide adenylyltransferase
LSRVGIYGGTFDPIHVGHLHVITQLIEKEIVDQILVVPAGEPLLRSQAPHASAQQRRAMCQLALSDLPIDVASKVQVNPIEVLRTGPSYAIDTVAAVAQRSMAPNRRVANDGRVCSYFTSWLRWKWN